MTFEEMQEIIQGMLAVQRELQEADIRLKQSINELAHENRVTTQNLNRLIGYGVDRETDFELLRDRVDGLTTRIDNLEQRS